MVNRLFVAAAWAAAARRPICILSLDKTEEGITVCGRFARLMPNSNWLLSFLKCPNKSNQYPKFYIFHKKKYKGKEEISTHQIKITESPATSRFALTNTLQPVVRRCLFGWPEI